jgi:RNA polymerase sigma factor (sigma-70 family)
MDKKTKLTLLERLRQGTDALVWQEFSDRYWRLIFAFARNRGCSEHTAEEIVQEVMVEVFRHRDTFCYDPARGRFRDWLGTVVRNLVAKYRRQPAQRVRGRGGDAEVPGPEVCGSMDLADDVSGTPGSADPGYRPATLQSRLEAGPLPPDECQRRACELLAGLATLHDAGMVHRDVKPANCLFVGGELRLADFGLLTEADRQMSRVGTESYMPPDGRMDARADVYAAGLTVYEMITGLPATCFPSLGDRADRFADDPILQRLNRLLLRACQPSSDARYENAREVLGELTRSEPHEGKWLFRHRGWVGLCVACLLLAVVLMAVQLGTSRVERVRVNFITEPFEATILLDGVPLLKTNGTPYTTPCTIPDLPGGNHQIVFQRPPLPDLDAGRVDFRESRDIERHWNSKALGSATAER